MKSTSNTATTVYDWIVNFAQEQGRSPTYREIAVGMGYTSIAPIQHHLKTLRDRGLIAWTKGRPGSITLSQYRWQLVPVQEVA